MAQYCVRVSDQQSVFVLYLTRSNQPANSYNYRNRWTRNTLKCTKQTTVAGILQIIYKEYKWTFDSRCGFSLAVMNPSCPWVLRKNISPMKHPKKHVTNIEITNECLKWFTNTQCPNVQLTQILANNLLSVRSLYSNWWVPPDGTTESHVPEWVISTQWWRLDQITSVNMSI